MTFSIPPPTLIHSLSSLSIKHTHTETGSIMPVMQWEVEVLLRATLASFTPLQHSPSLSSLSKL